MLLDITRTRTVIVRTHRVAHETRRCADVDLKCVEKSGPAGPRLLATGVHSRLQDPNPLFRAPS
jgi:hypothetical protein